MRGFDRCFTRIINISEVSDEERSGGIFLGTVLVKPMLDESHGCKNLRLDIVEFPPGARNKLHSQRAPRLMQAKNRASIFSVKATLSPLAM